LNYPIWSLPSPGLLIAAVAILHVFVSHFAVGGGLFLVVAERRARRQHDDAVLAFVRRLSRVFVLLTLVFGAISGVGIWFTIGLVSPQATSSLINIFVWGWAIEWTFFVVEIAAAMVYYYGWDRLRAAEHEAVGWIYFASAWLSLVVINGILSFMLTPGRWLETHAFLDGILNPTYVPSLVARTLVAVGLAGLYVLLVVSREPDAALRARVGRWAGLYWVLPTAVGIPAALVWFLHAAAGAGVPVGEIFGAGSDGAGALAAAILNPAASGQPIAQRAALTVVLASLVVLVVTVTLVTRRRFGTTGAVVVMAAGLVAMGGGEWVREVLRKPYVIGGYMFVNGVRLPSPPGTPQPPADTEGDRFTIDALDRGGVLNASVWATPAPDGADEVARRAAEGEQVFRLECRMCHTTDGYLGIRRLVAGLSPGAVERIVARLAVPAHADGQPSDWSGPQPRLTTWRGRRMPPFTGTYQERHALALYLSLVGGATPEGLATASAGMRVFEDNCAVCHGPTGDFQIHTAGRNVQELFSLIGRLPEVNDMMPPFEGTDAERRALAEYLNTRDESLPGGGVR
jgi:mono/diheme cytochrome c family protein